VIDNIQVSIVDINNFVGFEHLIAFGYHILDFSLLNSLYYVLFLTIQTILLKYKICI